MGPTLLAALACRLDYLLIGADVSSRQAVDGRIRHLKAKRARGWNR